ncbi:MAG: hypothetical protein ACI8UD_001535 [Planctomycetota bacterium]|jgi:hypothetical protein
MCWLSAEVAFTQCDPAIAVAHHEGRCHLARNGQRPIAGVLIAGVLIAWVLIAWV